MGNITWTVGEYAKDRAHNVMASVDHDNGAFTSSGSAAPITGLLPKAGQVVAFHTTTACRVRFGGRTSSASAGHAVGADQRFECEVSDSDAGLAVSVTEV